MNYLSFAFLFFIVVFVFFYYCVKQAYRYVILFFGSYFFYGYANPKMLIVLILVTLVSYFGGLIISKKRSKAAYVLFFALEVILLALFKYRVFLLTNISSAVELITGRSLWGGMWNIALPIGLSFMVFQACTYLSDVYRGRISVEKNIIKYATFVSFFPTVLSGPIQKSRYLLPQISAPKGFDYDQSKKGTLLFVWGAFEKIVVSNKLCQTYTGIYSNFGERASAELLIGAICFSLFIYSDFSAYSDMARGISKILGIDVGKNFINPYLSQNMSEFWNRWHVSLNEWFVENIYIPLGGSRKGKLRKIVYIPTV